jgi:hypothetical protein
MAITIADALARDHQHGRTIMQRTSEIGGAVEATRGGMQYHRRQFPCGAVVSCRDPYCQALVATVDIGGGRLSFGAPSRQGLPQRWPFGARRADDVLHAVTVEDLDKNLASIPLALYHGVISFCDRTPLPCLTNPSSC